MSDPKSTADDYRDRLVDRVLAEALGEERPPDLSQAILDKVEEEKVSVVQADQVAAKKPRRLRGRLVELAIAASVVGVLATLLLPTVHTARLATRSRAVEESAPETVTIAKPDSSDLRYQSSMPMLKDSNEASPPVRLKESAEGEFIVDVTAPENSTPQKQAYPTRAPNEAGDTIAGVPIQAVPSAEAPPQSTGVSQEQSQKQLFEQLARQQAEAPSRESQRWESFSSIDQKAVAPATPAMQPAESTPSPHYLTDNFQYYAPEPSNGPYGFAGGGEAFPKPEAWRDLSSSRRSRYKEVDQAFRDRYEPIHENAFVKPVGEDALSTFSIDVDTASYANVRQYLRDLRRMPPANAVRIEELVNYFEYGYEAPKAAEEEAESEAPFAANLGCSACPWKPEHKLVRIGVKGREVAVDKRPLSNLVFLIDVSGSMNQPNKLPLVISGLNALVNKLGENDRVAIVVYAGSEGVVLPSTGGDQKDAIRAALDRMTAGGSTAGGAGLRLAYEIAERNKIVGGVNRVVLCTDGDFNVGMTGTEELAKCVETRAKETNVYLTVLGFGRGNLNDAMLEQISGRGDGNYAYIDDFKEAHRVLSSDLSKTLVTIAKDVKLQVEFNPAKVASYRLIGYENRVMAAEDFNNDAKDAGDIGAGHTVTALYEVVPVGVEEPAPPVDGLKYQSVVDSVEDEARRVELTASRQGVAVGDDAAHEAPTAFADELLTLKIRYKQPEGGASKKLEFPLEDAGDDMSVSDADADFRWAAAVAEFGMLLRNSRHVGDGSFDTVLERARGAIGDDPQGYRAEFIDLVRRAKEVSGR
ncbi:YfbK domain-containing protein [Botrimarina mediterranea]|uniref:von Willebrand factor n=1 Tax=Botrimarina mediterranea TaxID=2528022 RepID=A0A518KBP9_9BACT|nr:von Willebrand factor type A domain-containing protein [Botrimarina mediterranea]QDV75227.1 von Willebrand factor [Botrimarina mediterranea]QDV79896.1 von Willebrand factor [Planctomycetes bacterium K2D]